MMFRRPRIRTRGPFLNVRGQVALSLAFGLAILAWELVR